MNKTYKSIYNERTGTFVAVAENVKAKGKPSSSRVSKAGGLVAAVAAGALLMGGALAEVVINEPDNTINFTTAGGSINFTGADGTIAGVSSITGLTGLTVGGALNATSLNVAGTNTIIDSTGITTNNINVGPVGNSTVISDTGVTVGSSTLSSAGLVIANNGPSVTTSGIHAGGQVITGVSEGIDNTDAVNVGQLNVVSGDVADNASAIAANSSEISAVRDIAGAGWDISAGNGAEVNVGSGGLVDFSGDGNIVIEVSQTGTDTNLEFSLADEISVEKVTAGSTVIDDDGLTAGDTVVDTDGVAVGDDVRLGDTGLVITDGSGNSTVTTAAGTTVTSDTGTTTVSAGNVTLAEGANTISIDGGTGIDMGGLKITGLADGSVSAGSSDAVTGDQLHKALFEGGEAYGVRYFRANSVADDSDAGGQESIAIGPNTISAGDSSFAAGDGASTTETAEGAIALGQGATAGTEDVVRADADGIGSVAIGRNSQAAGNSTVALGDGASVESEYADNATAVGAGARVTGNLGTGGTAVGANAHASAGNATALGTDARASGDGSIAVGQANAAAGSAFAAGSGAYAGTTRGIALGSGAGVGTEGNEAGDRTDHIAIGTNSGTGVVGNQTTAIGYGAGQAVIGDDNVALGTNAGGGLQGNNNISIGTLANDGGGARAQAIAIGDGTASGSDSVALGSGARAAGSETLALGKNSSAGSNGVAVGAHATAEGSNIALGRNSAAFESDVTGSGYLTGEVAPGSAVSVGNSNSGPAFQRRIINVADGAQRYDAVNVGQLQGAQRSVADLIGGGVALNADGSYSPITVQDSGGNDVTFNSVVEALGAVTDGTVEILPADAVRYNSDGTIAVAAGTAAGQAVNLGQLNEAVAESGVKYYGANTTIAANRLNDGATGDNAMAIGPAAVASGSSSMAVGHAARVNDGAHNGVAIGHDVSARSENATVLGNRSHTYDAGGVAIGQQAVSRGQNSIVMGTGAEADPKSGGTVDNAIVIGTGAEATADDGIAIGQSALASEDRAVAQGYDAHAMAVDSQAFGTRARTTGVSSQSSGTDAHASGTNAIATGTNSRGYATDGIAMGTGAISGFVTDIPGEAVRNQGSIAIGDTSRADNLNALALGVEANARAESATAIGDGAVATVDAEDGLAVGSSAHVTAQNASAFGQGAGATAADALAVGSGATASRQSASAIGHEAEALAQNASAFGQGARALHQGSVALGSDAITATPIGTASIAVDKNTYNFAGTSPVATVSVGDEGAERTITNVAAGRISAASTDAINGSQLHGTNMAVDALGNNLDTAGASVAAALGGTSTYDPVTHTVTAGLSVQNNNYTNVQDALTYVGQGWDVSAQGGFAANVAPGGTVDFNSPDGNVVIGRDGTNLTFELADDLVVDNSITVGGTGDTTVINGTSVSTTNLTATGETRLGDSFVVNNAGDVTYNGVEIANQNDGLNFAGNTGGAISKSLGDNTPLTIAGMLGAGDASTGENLRVDSDGTQLNLVMARDLTGLDSVTIRNGGPVINGGGINMADNQITNLADGTQDDHAVNLGQLNAVSDVANAGWNVSAQNGEARNVAPGGEVNFSNGDGNIDISRTVDSTDLVFDLSDNIELSEDGSLLIGDATDGSLLDADGLTVAGADGSTVVGDGSIAVTDAGGTTTIGGTQVVVGGAGGTSPITIDGDVGTIGGLSNITFDPDEAYSGGVAATQEQLSQVNTGLTTAGLNFVGDDTNAVHRDLGETLSITGSDSNIGVTRNATEDGLVIELAQNIDLSADGSVTTGSTVMNDDGLTVAGVSGNDPSTTVGAGVITVEGSGATPSTIVISGEAGTIGGLSNTTFDSSAIYTGGIAATQEQLSQVNTDLTTTGLNFVGDDGELVHRDLGETLSIEGGADLTALSEGNIGVTQNEDEDGLVIELADNIALSEDGSLLIGDATDGSLLDADGLTVAGADGSTVVGDGSIAVTDAGGTTTIGGTQVVVGGTSPITIDGDAGTIGGLSNTTFDPNATYTGGVAATQEQLSGVNTSLTTAGLDFVGDDGELVHRDLGETLSIEGGADLTALSEGNIGVTQNEDEDGLVIELADNIALSEDGSLAIGDGTDGSTLDVAGLTVVDGAGNATSTTAEGTTVTNAAGDTTTVGAGTIAVTDAGGATTIGSTQVVVGGTNSITIDGDVGTIGGLSNTTFDPNATYTGGVAATQEQLSGVNTSLTTAGLNFVGDDGLSVHRDLGEELSITGGATGTLSEGNIGVTQNEDEDGLVIELADNIALSEDGSLAIGDGTDGSTLDVAGLTVVDGAGNETSTTAEGTTVTNAAGDTTTVGAGTIAVADAGGTTTIGGTQVVVGGTNSITIDGDVGTIGGLSNTTFDPNATYTGGVAATQEQLSGVNTSLTTAGLNFVGDDGLSVHRDLGEELSITGGATGTLSEGNIGVTQNEDEDGLVIELAQNIDLSADGSVTTGDTVLNTAGLTVHNDTGNPTATTTVEAGKVTVWANPTTDPANEIVIDANTGTIVGLSNQSIEYPAFADDSGRAATENQLKQVRDIANMGWNISANEGVPSNVAPASLVDFSNTDENLTLAHGEIFDGNGDPIGQQIAVNLASTLEIGGDPATPGSGVRIGDEGAVDEDGNPTSGITIPGGTNDNQNIVIGGGEMTIHGLQDPRGGLAAPMQVGQTLMAGMNFAGNNSEGGGPVINKRFGETLEILGVDWIETEVGSDGKMYIKLADGFPVVPQPGGGSGQPGQPGQPGGPVKPGEGLGNIVAGGDIEAGKNINIISPDPSDPDDFTIVIETTPEVEHDRVTVGDVVIDKDTGINAGDHQITNVAAGTQNDHAVNLGQLDGGLQDLDDELTQKGLNFADSAGDVAHRDLGETMHIVGANENITTQVKQGSILEIALSNDLQVDSVTINNGGPIINSNGIDMSEKRITNVADGVEPGDAVNMGQLTRTADNLQGQVNNLRGDLRRQDRKLSAGVAAAMATASLPQAYLPGKTMMSMAAGTWNGESGMAVGFSGISDNGHWVYKLSGNSTSRGDYGGAVGIGYQW